ncbi:hypothetical protein NM208_g10562 [Fusarium decemcellulare]|uniref:Uncharacterized protein n=1 Tax=Fusarium decemcellulare TaxID=57161 RepID=A0ACC1RXF4_9HYPO|nr:hypothetical protein NM208_g10562 [Fusarium decemcellulare]
MTIIHMVFFKFRADVTQEHKETFVRELKKLKNLSCVKDNRLIVGGPSVTDPIERSKGFEFALLSYHENRAALDEYQASKEHAWVTQTYMFPYKEDLCRFDFEVAPEDEYMCTFEALTRLNGLQTPTEGAGLVLCYVSQLHVVDTAFGRFRSLTGHSGGWRMDPWIGFLPGREPFSDQLDNKSQTKPTLCSTHRICPVLRPADQFAMSALVVPRHITCRAFLPHHLRRVVSSATRYAGIRYSSSNSPSRVAVLYQALDPPIINGVRKPKKPGGYKDSGADIAYNLGQCNDVEVITPTSSPNPTENGDWCFPDTEDGILDAIGKGANYLWSNTIVFSSHPLQTSARLNPHESSVRVIGQGPHVVDKYDDKQFVNDYLRATGGFTMPRAFTVSSASSITESVDNVSYPVVVKPIRGRGSYGVKVCHNKNELLEHSEELSKNSMAFMVEEFLQGEEATVTVMPPTEEGKGYWSLPIVTRFNHQDGIAPYNGVVAVTANSRVVENGEADPLYNKLARECERAASILGVTAPIRIDVRRFKNSPDSPFALFDVNMKPNMTGPGRPGRDDQASLTLLAANGLGWDYKELLRRILATSSSLKVLRSLRPVTGPKGL